MIPSRETKKLLRALSGETVTPPPIWLMRQAGRYLPEYRAIRAKAKDFLALCLTPELAAEITLQPIRRFGFDAAILFSDILVIPFALGQDVRFAEGEGPKLAPIRDRASLSRLRDGQVRKILAPVFETVLRTAKALPPEVALIGFAGAPWTVACYMIEGGSSTQFDAVKKFSTNNADAFDELIDLLTGATADYLSAQIEAGAEAVQIFDSWAGLVPSGDFERRVVEPTKRIVQKLRAAHPGVPVIGFPRGAGENYVAYAAATGVQAVSLDTEVKPDWAARALRGVALQGNLDPQVLVRGGDAMRDAAAAILRAMAGRPFVFNLGHGIVPETPPQNVADLVGFVRDWTP